MAFFISDEPVPLQPNEFLVKLDTDELVAVSAVPERLHTGGMTVKGTARWVDNEGATKLDPDGKPVKNEWIHTYSPLTVESTTLDYRRRQVILALLGEETELALSEEVKININIRHDIAMVNELMDGNISGSPF